MMAYALVGRGLILLLAVVMAFRSLQAADKTCKAENWTWARHFMVAAHVWSAVVAIVGALIMGSFQ